MNLSNPLIYADMNIYRYVACNDMQIINYEDFTWVFSYVHLDEIARNGNQDALEGMKMLKAVEIYDHLDSSFQSVGDISIRDYIDPYTRHEQHLEAISGYEDMKTLHIELLLRIFGGNNFDELLTTPEMFRSNIEKLCEGQSEEIQLAFHDKANEISTVLKNVILSNFDETLPLERTRKAFGLTSEKRKTAEESINPIDALLTSMQHLIDTQTSEQYFGLKQTPALSAFSKTQHQAIAVSHTMLNLFGIYPDKGLSKREKLQNIYSDGEHLGLASYCCAFLSADTALCNKAKAIYQRYGIDTNVIHFDIKNGSSIELGFR